MNFTGIGTVVNILTIIVGTLLGLILKRGLPERVEKILVEAVSLAVVVIGIQMAMKTQNILVCVISIAVGAVIGEIIDLNKWFDRFGKWAGDKIAHGNEAVGTKVALGFVTASLLFCPGAMAVIGAIQDGLAGDPTTLFAKSILDGIFAVVMGANLGVGVGLSAVSVGAYQGVITLAAGVLEPIAIPAVLAEITSVGGVMVLGIGLNLLKVTKIKVANLMPGVVPAIVLSYWLANG